MGDARDRELVCDRIVRVGGYVKGNLSVTPERRLIGRPECRKEAGRK